MRKVIDGRMYNTETATLVGEYCYGFSSDWDYIREELYIKKTGEWFLYGEGGPSSEYREPCGSNNWCSGETIKPFSEKQAKRWLEENEYTDAYIEYFGEPEE